MAISPMFVGEDGGEFAADSRLLSPWPPPEIYNPTPWCWARQAFVELRIYSSWGYKMLEINI